MEIIGCGSTPYCQVVQTNWKFVEKSFNSRQSRVPSFGNHGISCSMRFLDRSLSVPEESRRFKSFRVYSGTSDGYVIGSEGEIAGIDEHAASKILIPGLPDGSNGEFGAPISSCFWQWKPKLNIHYEKAGCENVGSPNVLFLPGFGVGSFHYEKQLKDLGRDNRVWALDFLGQGMSLAFEDPAPKSKEDQVRYFIEEVIREPVYVVGNSLGGYVALYFAARNPHLVKGVTLLNATPFWGFLPNPIKNPRLAKLFPWAGTFPLPSGIRRFTELVWEKISDPASIAQVLNQVYADHSTNVDNVFSRIIETTRHPAAAASFASIMFAPQPEISFAEALSRCRENNVPICLMYGKEDPWVKPIWGVQVKKQVPEAPYYQISPAGHCPHDEVPEVINFLLRGWIRHLESSGSISLPLLDELDSKKHTNAIARELEYIRQGSKKSVMVRYFGSKISLWDRIISYTNSGSKLRNLTAAKSQP
ncbi:hypothetical protein PIB30_058890 [Stylosanthes scabra]|uniref:AB hydrolase-1 domain-containing protein n=1 Tax=Stylosanthes scabra TaxID=79078 RepID=A0ABU6YIP4_9FABA|nr:hypothetical protein [Stylosanthes scabra]